MANLEFIVVHREEVRSFVIVAIISGKQALSALVLSTKQKIAILAAVLRELVARQTTVPFIVFRSICSWWQS